MKPFSILYEDDHCVVINKPPGFLTTPATRGDSRDCSFLINQQWQAKNPQQVKLHPCHRLDKDTSGVLMFAKGKRAQQAFMALFQQQKVKKTYFACVHGQFEQVEGTIKRSVKDVYQKQYQSHVKAKKAITHYRVLEDRNGYSIIEAKPITGRTHQIRIHFADAGHPIVGEDRYAFRRDFALKFKRTALHANILEWPDLKEGHMIKVEAPLPKDLINFLNKHS